MPERNSPKLNTSVLIIIRVEMLMLLEMLKRCGSYFEREDKFDIVFSSACFEHFAMPWIVVIEISQIVEGSAGLFS